MATTESIHKSTTKPAATRLFGYLAEFSDAHAMVVAAEKVRDEGYKAWDTHTPFPVHGIDEAMGIRRTILPWVVFLCGLAGCATGVGLQYWVSAVNYPLIVSGKPFFSLPAFIPVAFELTILFAAFGAVFGMLGLNGLPRLYHGVFNSQRFSTRMTTDRFYISIEAADSRFDPDKTRKFLEGLKPDVVEALEEVVRDEFPPHLVRWGAIIGLILISVATIPPLVTYRARSRTSDVTRMQLIWDMDQQPKFKSQSANTLFADKRAMRPQVPGTVARGEGLTNEHLEHGMTDGKWTTTNALPIEEKLIKRGQRQFNIYCSQCHGLDGYGTGPVSVRAERLQEGTWVAPLSLHDKVVMEREDGHIFNTITNGIRTMPAYGDQIQVKDRWAIVAYLRALQRSQQATIEDVPADERDRLP